MSTTWYLRAEQGVIFGPAPINVLREWAEQGRIGPESQLSSDRKSWVPAHTLAELEMDWMFDLGSGIIGPVNLRALRDLVLDGVIPSTTLLVHRQTKTKHPLHRKLDQIFGQPPTPPQNMRTPAADTSLDTATTDPLEARLQRTTEQNASLAAELQTVRELLVKEQRQAELQQEESRKALQQAEASRVSTAAALDAEIRKTADYSRKLESAEKLAAQAKSESTATSQQLQQSQQAQAEIARHQSETDEQWRLAEAKLRAALDAERAEASAAKRKAQDQEVAFQARADAWRKTELALNDELKAAHDARVLAKADTEKQMRDHSTQAECWRQSEEKLRRALEEAARELARTKDSLRDSETARDLQQRQASTSTQQEQTLRTEIDRLIHQIAGLEATIRQITVDRDTAQSRIVALMRESDRKDAAHRASIARLEADQQNLHAVATEAKASLNQTLQRHESGELLATKRQEELLQQLTHITQQKQLLETRLRQAESKPDKHQDPIGKAARVDCSPTPPEPPPARTIVDAPPSGKDRPSPERPEVHEPEVLPPSSKTRPPHQRNDEAETARPSFTTSTAESWLGGIGNRGNGKNDSKSATLADLEAQAQRDLLAWQKGKAPQKRARPSTP